MGKDILFKTDEFIFSYRVAGILINNGKILLQKPDNDDGWAIPGGHVAFGETSDVTLKREFSEEINANIQVGCLMAVGEVFFQWGTRPCHQIGLYYYVSLNNTSKIPLEGTFVSRERNDLKFRWFELNDLNMTKIYPEEIKNNLFTQSKEVLHFVSNQL